MGKGGKGCRLSALVRCWRSLCSLSWSVRSGRCWRSASSSRWASCIASSALVASLVLGLAQPRAAYASTYVATYDRQASQVEVAAEYLGYDWDELPQDVKTWAYGSTVDGGEGTDASPNLAGLADFANTLSSAASPSGGFVWSSSRDGVFFTLAVDDARRDMTRAVKLYNDNDNSEQLDESGTYTVVPIYSNGWLLNSYGNAAFSGALDEPIYTWNSNNSQYQKATNYIVNINSDGMSKIKEELGRYDNPVVYLVLGNQTGTGDRIANNRYWVVIIYVTSAGNIVLGSNDNYATYGHLISGDYSKISSSYISYNNGFTGSSYSVTRYTNASNRRMSGNYPLYSYASLIMDKPTIQYPYPIGPTKPELPAAAAT